LNIEALYNIYSDQLFINNKDMGNKSRAIQSETNSAKHIEEEFKGGQDPI